MRKTLEVRSDFIAALMERSGFGLVDFQTACGAKADGAPAVSLSYLSEVVSGTKTKVGPPIVKAMADALKVPMTVLLASPNEAAA